MKKFKIKSYCKINLSLKVLKKLNNGYHSIKSLITYCKLHDMISIFKIEGSKDKISFSGKFKKGINIKSNTITKALSLLRKKKFFKNQAFNINVKKNIPHGSGLGGGSCNAASIVNFFKLKMNLKLNKIDIIQIVNQIGFDVPICLEKKNTLLTGKKNQILRINKKFSLNILIVYPNIICSTKKIYKNIKDFKYVRLKPNLYIKDKDTLMDFLKREKNDLEKIVIKFYPMISKIINFIKSQNGCYFSRITGSGSACIGIFANKKTASLAQKLVRIKFPKYWSFVSKTI